MPSDLPASFACLVSLISGKQQIQELVHVDLVLIIRVWWSRLWRPTQSVFQRCRMPSCARPGTALLPN